MRFFFSLFLICHLAFGGNHFSPKGPTAYWDTTTAAGILNGTGNWTNTSTLWTYENGAANSPFCQGCNVSFGKADSTGNAGTVTITGTQQINSMAFNSVAGGNYTVTGGIISCVGSTSCPYTANVSATIASNISGSKSLIKEGTQNLILTADNTFTGTVDINAGTLTFSTPNFNTYRGGQININGASTMSVVQTGGVVRYDFPAMTFNFNNVGGGTISTGAGVNWVQQGMWTFATNGGAKNTITGSARINMNTFVTTFDVADGTDPTSDLDVTIELGNTAQGITKNGAGTARLTANTNSYTGTTTVDAGTLSLGDGVTTGNIIPAANLITDNATLTYNTPSTITHSGIISGTGTFEKKGTGDLTLSGVNTYSGPTTVTAGTLTATISVSAIRGDVNIAAGATAALNVTGTQTYSNKFSGAGTLKVTAGGVGSTNTSLSGDLSGLTGTLDIFPSGGGGGKVNPTTAIQANTMPAGSLVRLRAGATTFLPNALNYAASFELNGGGTGEALGNLRVENGTVTGPVTLLATSTVGTNGATGFISGVISGGFGLTKVGAGIITLTGNNTYTGTTTISVGTLQLGDGVTTNNIIPTANLITNNATFVYNTPSNITHSGVISGTGTLTKQGTGTLTLSGADTFTGITTVSAGTLSLGNGVTAGNIIPDTNLITNNATLVYNTPSTITHSGVISGTGTLTKRGTGQLTLSGVNTYSGGTTISSGTLIASIDNGGTGTITLGDVNTGASGVTWNFSGGAANVPTNNVIVANQGMGSVTIGTGVAGGTFTNVPGNLSLNRSTTLIDTTGDRTSFNGLISGNVGTISITGPRITFGNAANTFVGNLSVANGSIYQSDTAGALPATTDVTLNGNARYRLNGGGTHSIRSLISASATSSVDIVAGGNATLSLGTTGDQTFAGVISNGAATLSINIKNNGGVNRFHGANTYTGGTTINGYLLINNANGAGTGTITINAGGTLDCSNQNIANVVVKNGGNTFNCPNRP